MRLVIDIENKTNFTLMYNLLQQIPFVKLQRVEKKQEHTLDELRKEIKTARQEYKKGDYKTLEQLMAETDV